MAEISLKNAAKAYFDFGLNITQINKNSLKNTVENPSKSPITDHWKYFTLRKQDKFENWWYEFPQFSGIGTILGPTLRCIDIDDCEDDDLIKDILNILGLPLNYEWTIKTGSGKGYHILFQCDTHNFPVAWGKIKSFLSNGIREFKRLELRWFGHLVLPPSSHNSGNNYIFLFKEFPKKKPLVINENKIDFIIKKYCKDDNLVGSSGLYLDYGPSYVSKEVSIINDDLSIAFTPKIKLIFAIKFNNYDKMIMALSWLLVDSKNKVIEYCNYFINPQYYNSFWSPGYYDCAHESNIASLIDVGVPVCEALIAFKNRIEISDECFELKEIIKSNSHIFLDGKSPNITQEKILFYYKSFGIFFNSRSFEKFRDLDVLIEESKIPKKILTYHQNSFFKPTFEKLIQFFKLIE